MFGSSGAGLRLFNVRGIPVDLDATALLLIAFYAFSIGSSAGLVVGLVVAIGIVVSILIHELAHALVGSLVGAKVAGIRLHVLGGATFFASKPPSYFKDMLISIAGPASNFVLWQVCQLAANTLFDGFIGQGSTGGLREIISILLALSYVNLFLGLFNALPGFPLDGGQAVHSLLMWLTRREKLAAGVVMVLGCLSAVGIIFYYTNGFQFGRNSLSIGLIFALYIAYWIASSSIALYKQAQSPVKPTITPRQQAEIQQQQLAQRAKSHPGHAAFEQGRAFLLSREYGSAVESFNQALQFEPDEIDYLDYRAYTYGQMNDYASALRDFSQLIQKAPHRADFYTARALIYKNIGNLDAARADVEYALQINPAETYALQLRQELARVG